MLKTMTAQQVLDREYLEIRCKILELAASFDRLDSAAGADDPTADQTLADDPRLKLIRQALQELSSDETDRAERVQLIFSRQYDEDWREKFGLVAGRKPR